MIEINRAVAVGMADGPRAGLAILEPVLASGSLAAQFLSEAILLSLLGGAAGVALGALSTAGYAHAKGWAIVIPVEAWSVGGDRFRSLLLHSGGLRDLAAPH